MDDLVKRLRGRVIARLSLKKPSRLDRFDAALDDEAAEEITRLRTKVAQLEADRAQWVELPRLTMGKQEKG